MKRGRPKTGRHCGRCRTVLTDDNGYKRKAGGFASHCKECNAEIAYIALWRKASLKERMAHIYDLQRRIKLITEIDWPEQD